MTNKLIFAALITFFCASKLAAQSQTGVDNKDLGRDSVRVITTAVPFLTISPDARSGALGDAGVAISPDANSIRWNPAKLAFIEKKMGLSISYTPWLHKLVQDMSISYLSAYLKPRKEEAIGISLLFFDLGDIQFTDQNGQNLQKVSPKEYSVGATYSRKLSDNLGVALGLKYINSNIGGSVTFPDGSTSKPGVAAAADIGVYYNKDMVVGSAPSKLAFGGTITNIGNKISYTNSNNKSFIPTAIRLGTAFTTELDPFNKLTFTIDANKLMVPSTPVYEQDATGKYVLDAEKNPKIVRGKDPNRALMSGMFGSFSDAPDGLKEELKEVIVSGGVEYWYNDLFAARGGYFHESALKGKRRYFTLGFGIRYQVFGLDFAYLIPVKQNNPLAETLRFTLHFNFENKSPIEEESITEE